jgi:ATP-binding cassette subfamily C protein PrsD
MTKPKRDRLTLFAECLANNQEFKQVFVKALAGALVFSAVVNVLALVGPIFMLEVYDRVLPSKSVPTLVALGLLAMAIYAFSGFIDVIRMRVMSRVASSLDVSLSSRVFAVIAGVPLKTHIAGDALKPAQELDQIRTFIAGPGFLALFDLPWVPVYLAVCFYIHAYLGWLTAFMMLILVGLTLLTDWRTRRLVQQAASALEKRNQHGQQSYRNAESLAAMGMQARALALWDRHLLDYSTLQLKAGDISSMFSGISKALRHMVQSASLALGAYLVIRGDMSGGMIIAASVIVARALAPAEQVIAMWRSFLGAKNS